MKRKKFLHFIHYTVFISILNCRYKTELLMIFLPFSTDYTDGIRPLKLPAGRISGHRKGL